MSDKKIVGVVTRYFAKIGVAAIMLEGTLKVGSKISVEGTTTNFQQNVASMQIDRAEIEVGEAGQEIAIKVSDRVREKDKIYLLE